MSDMFIKPIESIEIDTTESSNFVSMATLNSDSKIKMVESVEFDNSVFENSINSNYKETTDGDVSDDEINAYIGEKRRQDYPLLSGDNGLGDIIVSYKENELASKKFYTQILICGVMSIVVLLLTCFLLLLSFLFR